MTTNPGYRDDSKCLLRALEAHRVSSFDLWVSYLGLGGLLDNLDVEAYLHGLITVSDLEHLLLDEAAREILAEQ